MAGRDSRSADKLELLGDVAIFSRLPSAVLADVAESLKRREWARGVTLFQRGDPSNYLVIVEHGHIQLSLQSAAGREFVLKHAHGGAVFGEIGVLDGEPRSTDATALEDTAGYTMDRRDVFDLGARHPEFMQAVITHLCAMLRYTTAHFEAVALYGLEARLARFFLSEIREIHGENPPDQPRLRLDLNQTEIAEFLGGSRPKVNRALLALQSAGAVVRDGDHVVCDPDKLMELANPED